MSLLNLGKKNGKTKEPTCACNSNVKEVKTENSCKDCGCAGANERIQSLKSNRGRELNSQNEILRGGCNEKQKESGIYLCS